MTTPCDRTLDLLAESTALDAEARAHLATCATCRAMAGDDEALEALVAPTSVAPPMSAALAAVIREPVAPARLRAPSVRALAAIAPAVVVVIAVVSVAIRRDFAALSWVSRWLPVLSLAVLSLVGVSVASSRGRDGLGRSHAIRIGIAAATIVAFELLSTLLGVEPLWGGELGHHLSCSLTGVLLPFALVPLTMIALRRTDAVRPAMGGAAIGAAVASVIAVIQHLECASPSRMHVAGAHGVSFIVSMAIGAWLGRRWLAP